MCLMQDVTEAEEKIKNLMEKVLEVEEELKVISDFNNEACRVLVSNIRKMNFLFRLSIP
jgi:hypothetical protein